MSRTFRDALRLKDIIECTCDGLASVTDSPEIVSHARVKSLLIHSVVKLDEGHGADSASLNLSSEAEH